MRFLLIALALAVLSAPDAKGEPPMIDMTDAVIVVADDAPTDVKFAAYVLAEEAGKRTGTAWKIVDDLNGESPAIFLSLDAENATLGPEGYRVEIDLVETWVSGPPLVNIEATTRRGLLFGVGRLLRELYWTPHGALIKSDLNVTTLPNQELRGHQLGYRPMPNSYDAWSVEQFEQYIRELVFFGTNAIESIPTTTEEGVRTNELMLMTREEMNVEISRICSEYGIAFWIFTPAMVDLSKPDAVRELLAAHEEFYRSAPRIDVVFVPGGDPGHNHPRDLMPFLKKLNDLVKRYHPEAGVWFSMQKFEPDKAEWTFDFLDREQPDWIAGIVAGPWDPGIEVLRERLPEKYPIRGYPDITHNIRCQMPVPWWDPALNMTLGREAPNPRPEEMAIRHEAYTAGMIGFLAYSEGIHDDVNKTVWSLRGWDPGVPVRDMMVDYAGFFFGADAAELAADGILAFERSWQGPLATNGGVEANLTLWRELERNHPELQGNWRFQLHLLRAYFDAYVRSRLLNESALEEKANRVLAAAPEIGADAAMAAAERILARATDEPIRQDLRQRIEELAYEMFRSIGYQTSVEKYGAHGPERGAILDFVDHPLNNRWWLEDQFAEIRALENEAERLARLEAIRTWESPGEGSFYDDIGNVAKMPHVIRGETIHTDPMMERNPNPFAMWWNQGMTRVRQSWISDIHWPLGIRYDNLDREAEYVVRMTGYGDIRLRIDGTRAKPARYGRERTDVKEWAVPREALADGTIILTFDDPDVGNIHWREWSRVNEVWLLKR